MALIAATFVAIVSAYSCFNNAKKPYYKPWLSSIDSLLSKKPPPNIQRLCQISKSISFIDSTEFIERSRKLSRGNKNFDLAIFIDLAKSDSNIYGCYHRSIKVIHIYQALDTIIYGKDNEWISRAMILLHEIAHAASVGSNEEFAVAIEVSVLNIANPNLQDSLSRFAKRYYYKQTLATQMFTIFFLTQHQKEGKIFLDRIENTFLKEQIVVLDSIQNCKRID